MGVTDWRAMALVETAFRVHNKIPISIDERPRPSLPRFSEQPSERFSRSMAQSVGFEQPLPPTVGQLKAKTTYVVDRLPEVADHR